MTTLTSATLRLRNFTDADQARLAELCNNQKIWNNVRDSFPSPYTEENATEFILSCGKEDPQTTFAIEYNGALVGCIGLTIQKDVYRLSAEIGYWIGEPYWGLGIATKAVELMTAYGFETLKMVRIYSAVFGFNKASQRVLEKSGYLLECIAQNAVVKNGQIGHEFRYAKQKGQ